MNVTVENLGPCKKLLRFEIDAGAVDNAFADMAKEFQRRSRLQGFRPGKAPLEMIEKRYEKEIAEEAQRKLISDAYRDCLKEQKLEVVGYPEIEEVQFGRGQPLQFLATVETAPEFQMPEYRGLRARREKRSVTDADITAGLEVLQTQHATFITVNRPVQEGDFVVIDYTGTSEGKPLSELTPAAQSLASQKNFWIEAKPDSFLPGFAQQLIGANKGDKRTVTLTFPADFVTPELSGKEALFDVEVVEVKERVLPEVNDAFAGAFGAANLDRLREGVRQDLQNELNLKQKRSLRNQIVRGLLDQVQFDLPETPVKQETRSLVYELVHENQKRGVPGEAIEKQKDEIYSAAAQSARERVKISYLFNRIAEREGIRVLQEELDARVAALSQGYKMTPQKFRQELEKRDGLADIVQQILHEKVIAFLHENATIEDVEPQAT